MSVNNIDILLIEDDLVDQKAFERMVSSNNLPYNYQIVDSVAKTKQILKNNKYDIIVSDYMLPDGKSFEFFDSIIDTPIIFITGAGDQQIAVQAMKSGAYDYLIKDPDRKYLEFLPITVENAIKHAQGEKQLRLLESAVVNTNDAVLITEAENYDLPSPKVVYVNDAFTKMTQYLPEEIIGKAPRILNGPRTQSEALDEIKKALENSKPCRQELINYRKDGSEYWVDLNIIPLRDKRSVLTNFLFILRDITDKKLAEIKLRDLLEEVKKSNEEKLSILNELKIGTAINDTKGSVIFINRFMEIILNKNFKDIKGKNWNELFAFSKEDKANIEVMYHLDANLREKIPVQLEVSENKIYWMDIEIKDEPSNNDMKIFYFYDLTEVHQLRNELEDKSKYHNIIGKSQSMKIVYEKIKEVAKVDWTVLIEGQTGTGKEMVAKAIHNESSRKDKPFIAVNCGALTESLLSSQLFGHKKGSFTGALSDQEGFFEAADGGTIFLDEIGDIPMNIQTNLLRVLQEKEITRIGENKPRKINVRVIAASQHDLIKEVNDGKFRADLLYRIRVTRINLPNLNERKDDIPLLANNFLSESRASSSKSVYEISSSAMNKMLNYSWPGNVRELKSAIDYAAISCKGPVIDLEDLPPEIIDSGRNHHISSDSLKLNEKQKILAALEESAGNRKDASKILGISRATLYRRLTKYNLI